LINGFKDTVLHDAREKRTKKEISNIQKTAQKLSEKSIGTTTLETELNLLLSQKYNSAQIQKIIDNIKNDALQKNLDPKRLLANRIAQMDLNRAKRLVRDC
jgi:ribosomal protein L22